MEQTFATWLRRQLKRRDWTQSDFARKGEFATSTVSDWFNDKRVPDPANCEKIADVLFLPIDDVLIAAGHKPQEDPVSEARRLASSAVKDMVMLGLERMDAVNRAELLEELSQYYQDDIRRLRESADDSE